MEPEQPTSSPVSKPEILALSVIVLIGAAFRVFASIGRVLIDDEVGTGFLAPRSFGYLMSHYTDWHTHPGHLLMARLSGLIFSFDEFGLRLPSILFGVLGIVLIHSLARRLFDSKTAMLAALFLALHPYHLFYSQMARTYAITATLATLSFLLIVKLVDSGRIRYAVAWVLTTVVSVYCHASCASLVPIQIAVAVWIAYRKRDRLPFKKVAIVVVVSAGLSGLLTILLYLPLLDAMVEYRSRWTGEDDGGFSFGFVPLLLSTLSGGRGLSVYAFLGLAVVGYCRAARRDGPATLVLLGWPLGLLGFYLVNNTTYYPWVYVRFFLIALPASIIALAHGVATLHEALAGRFARGTAARRGLLAATVGLVLLLTSTKIATICFGRRDTNWREALNDVESRWPRGIPMFSVPMRFSSFPYYRNQVSTDSGPNITPSELAAIIRNPPPNFPLLRPVAYVFDCIPLEEIDWPPSVEITLHGTNRFVYRKDWRQAPERLAMLDLIRILRKTTEFFESIETTVIREDWEFWRMGVHHEHLYVCRDQLPSLYRILAAAQARIGETEEANESERLSALWKERHCAPAQVRSSWTMLGPHFDFLSHESGAPIVPGAGR